MILRRITVLLALIIAVHATTRCRTESAQKGCGACIQTHPSCAWCSDPNFSGSYRCDSADSLGSCPDEFLLNPKTEVDRDGDRTVGEMKEDGSTKYQLQPQRVKVKLRKGDRAQFDVTHLYLGDEPKNILMLNSEVASQGLTLTYTVTCHGKEIQASQCDDIEPNTNITFTATMTLEDCKPGDKVVSVGVGGLRDVSALYVTPICSCDCESVENIEYNSGECSGNGELVCGQCRCNPGYQGNKCDCSHGAQSADDEACRSEPGRELCSGNGECSCGECRCRNPYTGKFCECDNHSCEIGENGHMCNGRGQCECGLCTCDRDYEGKACECSKNTEMCTPNEGGGLCSGYGTCKCNKCHCHAGHTGDHCEIEDAAAPEEEHVPIIRDEQNIVAETEVPKVEDVDVGPITSSANTMHLTTGIVLLLSYFTLY